MGRRIIFLSSLAESSEMHHFMEGEGKGWEVFSLAGEATPSGAESSRFLDSTHFLPVGQVDDVELAGKFARHLEAKTFNGTPFRSLASHREVALWDLQESDFIKFITVPLVRTVRILKALVQEARPREIALLEGNGALKSLVYSLSKLEGIPLKTIPRRGTAKMLDRWTVTLHPQVGGWKGEVFLPKPVWKALKPLKDRSFHFSSHLLNLKRGAYGPREPSDRRIVFLSIDKRNLDPVLPVYREISGRTGFRPILVDYNFSSAGKVLRKRGISYFHFDGFFPKDTLSSIRSLQSSLNEQWRLIREHPAFLDSLEILGMPVGRALEKELADLFHRIYPRIARHMETVGNLKRVLDPACIVLTGERHTFGRAVASGAKVFGLKSLCVQHGAIFPQCIWEPLIFTDKFAAYGDVVREVLLRYGNRQEDVVVTGEPRFDRMVSGEGILPEQLVRGHFGVPPGASLIVLATQPSGFEISWDENTRFCRGVIESVRRYPDTFLIIKLHPQEDGALQRGLLREGEDRIRMVREFDLYSIMSACDLFITAFSTAGMEAILMDKPLITINLTPRPDPIPYAEEGASLGVNREEEIGEAIERALHSKEVCTDLRKGREQFIRRHVHSRDGKASARIADLLEEMIEGRKE